MKIPYNKVWFTSDLHFGHKNVCKYCNRPYESMEEMHQALITNWNSVVQEDDTVFLLGDLGFCGITKLQELVAQLKGNIIVVQGNHDSDKAMNRLLEDGLIQSCVKLCKVTIEGDEEIPSQDLTLCHFPMIDWYEKEKGSWMIHGHQHQLPDTPSCSYKHYDVGVDKNNWTPINFEQLKIQITKQFLNRHENL